MAYCDRCGAYIPDGWTACPACGYDREEEEKQNQQAAAQAHQQEQEKFVREEAEKRRAQRQAYDKVWAENEQRRRREEEEYRRRQQEQEERRRQEQEERRTAQQNIGGVHIFVDADGTKKVQIGDKVRVVVNKDGTKKVDVDNGGNDDTDHNFKYDFNFQDTNKAEETIKNVGGKILPLLSYLGPLCLIPLLIGNNDSFTRFHARQGLRLFLWSAILEGLGTMFGIGWAVGFFQILMSIIGIKNVMNGEEKKLPYIGG